MNKQYLYTRGANMFRGVLVSPTRHHIVRRARKVQRACVCSLRIRISLERTVLYSVFNKQNDNNICIHAAYCAPRPTARKDLRILPENVENDCRRRRTGTCFAERKLIARGCIIMILRQ